MENKRIHLFGIVCLLLATCLIAALVAGVRTPASSARAASVLAPLLQDEVSWFDNDWDYRRIVSITSPCSADAAGYQVQINLDSSFDFSKALPDGGDLLFTASDGVTLLPHWIESWDPVGGSASLWVKLASMPVAGTSVYLYYGNPNPPAEIIVETPPMGPWTRAAGNPIVPAGGPADGRSLLAENIVYDAATGHYWMVHANYNDGGVGLVWSDTPTDPASWHWHGTVVASANAPHILAYDGKWYIVFSDWSTPSTTTRHSIQIVEATDIGGPYSNRTTILSPAPYTWENWRVDEPYLFQREDGKWILVYMGDQGDFENGQYYYEQVGYAIADSLLGPYTKFAGNPFLAWGPPGSFDAGTIADAWVVEFHGTYYIGYTVSPTIYSPWQTAVATTTDWENFSKLGVIFPLGPTGAWDAVNSFRGAVTLIDDTYVLAYTGDSFQMGTATQPVFQPLAINNAASVFNFYDGFDGTSLDTGKWRFDSGTTSHTSVSGGLLTLTATGTYVKINALNTFGMDTLIETYARHPQAGTLNLISELGWSGSGFADTVRMADDFHNVTFWERQAKTSTTPGDPWTNMAVAVDSGWHTFRIYRTGANTAGFQIDDLPVETTTAEVPTINLSPFLMSYGSGNQLVSDWVRVRNYCGADAGAVVGVEEPRPLQGQMTIEKGGDTQITSGSTANFEITVTNTGDFDLSDVAVSDPLAPDCDRYIGSLPIDQNFIYSCSLADVTDDLTNTAEVNGTTPGGTPISASDNHSVDVLQPEITIDVIPETQSIYSGTAAAFQVSVSNTGDSDLSDINVISSQAPDCARYFAALATGASVSYICSVPNVTANFTATVDVYALPPLGLAIAASDTAEVVVLNLEDAPWMAPGWHYRRPVIVTNPCGEETSEYQVKISLDASFDFSKAKIDGSDLRVTSSDGTTQIPFWIESWDLAGNSAQIWVKVPELPISGAAVFVYYGNPNPPGAAQIEMPPTGPWARAAGNPIVPIGGPADGRSLLAENIVYDSVTGHYWMVHANYNNGSVGLVWSDTPTDPDSWQWHGTVVDSANAPHILQHAGKWYIFFSDWSTPWNTTRHSIQAVEATDIGGPYSNRTTILSPEPYTWENWRVDEPYLFQRDDGKWILLYMGDQGDFENGQYYYEQVGYAIADNLLGPYTKFAGNPALAWGAPGSFDAGTIADPWVVEFHGTYYIGYTVSSSIYSPWQTAVATTTDWLTFNKLGVIFPLGPTGAWDAPNAFRGAVTRIDDNYVFAYTGDGYQMGIATQPVYQAEPLNDPAAVFNFYDAFDGSVVDTSKWTYHLEGLRTGNASVSGGILSLSATGSTSGYDLIEMIGTQLLPRGVLLESQARHPDANGTDQTAAELGFGDAPRANMVRILDYDQPNFIKNTSTGGTGGQDYLPMAQALDSTNYLLHQIYWREDSQAWFALDNSPWEVVSANVPPGPLPVWLMVYSAPRPTTLEVDWVRVRNFCGAEAMTEILAEQYHNNPPQAVYDTYEMIQGETLVVPSPGVLTNDSDLNDDPITADLVSGPDHGNFSLDSDGSFTYAPDVTFTGMDHFTYRAYDGAVYSNPATVTITVAGLATPTPTPTATATNTPTPTADTNLIFSDGFESGDFSVWSSVYTGDGDLTVSPDAALVGSFGMHALINDNFALYVQDDNPIAEDHYQTSFYFDPNSIPMGQGDILAIFFAYADPATVVIRFELRYFNGVYQVRPRMVTDSGTWASGPWIALADTPQRFQLDWQGASAPAANNGSLVFWIDGVLRASISGVDNDTRRIDYIRMGSVAAAMPTTRGVLFFDQFQSWRAGGAVPPTRTPTLTATSTSTSTQTPTPTQTGTPAPTATETPTPTETLMPTPTTTSEPTNTPTSTPTETQTPTPTAVPTETATPTATEFGILFADGFESGDFSVWSSVYTGDGDLTVSPDAALVGSFGMHALINDNFALYVQDDNPTAEDHYQTSFYFDPNSIPMGQGDMLAIFFAYADPATVVVRFELRYFNGVYQLRPRMVTDIGTWASAPWIPLSDAPQRFQLDWHGASAPGANDGALVFWIDGVQRASISAVDNDTRRIDYIRMGSVGAAMPTTRGVLFFDQFESTR